MNISNDAPVQSESPIKHDLLMLESPSYSDKLWDPDNPYQEEEELNEITPWFSVKIEVVDKSKSQQLPKEDRPQKSVLIRNTLQKFYQDFPSKSMIEGSAQWSKSRKNKRRTIQCQSYERENSSTNDEESTSMNLQSFPIKKTFGKRSESYSHMSSIVQTKDLTRRNSRLLENVYQEKDKSSRNLNGFRVTQLIAGFDHSFRQDKVLIQQKKIFQQQQQSNQVYLKKENLPIKAKPIISLVQIGNFEIEQKPSTFKLIQRNKIEHQQRMKDVRDKINAFKKELKHTVVQEIEKESNICAKVIQTEQIKRNISNALKKVNLVGPLNHVVRVQKLSYREPQQVIIKKSNSIDAFFAKNDENSNRNSNQRQLVKEQLEKISTYYDKNIRRF